MAMVSDTRAISANGQRLARISPGDIALKAAFHDDQEMGEWNRLRQPLQKHCGHVLDRRGEARHQNGGHADGEGAKDGLLLGRADRGNHQADAHHRQDEQDQADKKQRNEPLNGIWNGPAAAAIIRSPSMVPMTSAGSDLDTMISGVEVGDTSNWSNVPSSRSRAIDSEVINSALKKANMPERPGTMNQRYVRLGLNQLRTAAGVADRRRRWPPLQPRQRWQRDNRW